MSDKPHHVFTMKKMICVGVFSLLLGALSVCAMGEADIDVLSWMWYRGEHDTYHVVGEVENLGTSSAQFVKVLATLYNETGGIVDTDFTYTYVDVIAPGERSPFKLTFWDLSATPERCRIQWQSRETGQLPERLVTVSNIRGYYDSDYKAFKVMGEVVNDSGFAVEFVRIVLTCYDADGEVVSCDFTYSALDAIPPGGTSPFDAWISGQASRVESFRYIVEYRRL